MSRREEIARLERQLPLGNDARYWDLVRTYGEYSEEVLRHLRACAAYRLGAAADSAPEPTHPSAAAFLAEIESP